MEFDASPVAKYAIARGRALKRKNELTAALSGCLPAVVLGFVSPSRFETWGIGLVAGFLWANWFEYAYHRWLLTGMEPFSRGSTSATICRWVRQPKQSTSL